MVKSTKSRKRAAKKLAADEDSWGLMANVDWGSVDGRTLRRTGRTHQFATRIKQETHDDMKRLAVRDGITLAELLERAIEVYKVQKKA